MHSRMGRYNSNARNRAFNRTLNGSNLTPANMSSNDRSTSVRSIGTVCSIIQENQQTCQESATAHPVTLGVGIGLIANGTLADSESFASDSTHLMIDLNVPYVPDGGYSEVDGAVGFDVKEMIHNQQCLRGRKRKAPGSTSVNITDSESSDSDSTNLMIDLNVPYVPNDGYSEVDGAVGFDVNEVIHNQQCLRGRKRKAPSLNIADSESSASDSTHLMIDLNVPCVLDEGDSEVDGAVAFDVSSSQSTHLHFAGASRVALVENSTHLTFSEQHTNFNGGISSSSRNQSSAFIQPSITHMMMRDLPESALRYQSNAVIQPSIGPMRYLRANEVGDTRRAANFLRGRSMINDIDPPPLPLVIGETVAADNRERLLSAAGSVREPGHRDDPIVIEDDEEDELGDTQQGVIHAFVENLSYEEFLAFQELMGDTGTGLKKKVISELMKQHKYQSTKMSNGNDSCCVCLDTYGDGEELGKIDCGHEFDYHCIRKWLKINNTCPICKRTALTP